MNKCESMQIGFAAIPFLVLATPRLPVSFSSVLQTIIMLICNIYLSWCIKIDKWNENFSFFVENYANGIDMRCKNHFQFVDERIVLSFVAWSVKIRKRSLIDWNLNKKFYLMNQKRFSASWNFINVSFEKISCPSLSRKKISEKISTEIHSRNFLSQRRENAVNNTGEKICIKSSPRVETIWVNWRLTQNEQNLIFASLPSVLQKTSQDSLGSRKKENSKLHTKRLIKKKHKANQSLMLYWPWNKLLLHIQSSHSLISVVLWLIFTTHLKLKFTEVEIPCSSPLIMTGSLMRFSFRVKKCRWMKSSRNQPANSIALIRLTSKHSPLLFDTKTRKSRKSSFRCHEWDEIEAKLICVKLNFHFFLFVCLWMDGCEL